MPAIPSLAARVIEPIRSIILRLLPDFADRALGDPAVRELIIAAADITLISEFPAARALPVALRHKIIARVLDLIIGESAARAADAGGGSLEALGLDEMELAELEASAPGNSVRGFLVDAEPGTPPAVVAAAVTEILGEGWETVRLGDDSISFRTTHPDVILSVPDAWELSHRLEEHPTVALAEPEIEWVPAPAEIGGEPPNVQRNLRRAARGPSHLSCSVPKDWHLALVRAPQAWQIDGSKGLGVTIAHLDTGVTDHDEAPISGGNIDVRSHNNLYDWTTSPFGDKPIDPMTGGFGNNPGHGTGTISILTGDKQLTGTAVNATVVPYRVGPSVVHFEPVRIATAIQRAHRDGCDVISMSMGGPPSRTKWLDQVVAAAAEDGVIMCTAAGNQIGSNDAVYLVVWPAALDQVIAVAGCNCEMRVWTGSSRGPEVNITAAAEDVWKAVVRSPGVADTVAQGEGTSYATPTVAGMAACWLSHHGGRKNLASHYGHARYVPLAFAYLLRTTAYHRPPQGWDTKRLGPGMLDAAKLLAAPLPAKSELQSWPQKDHPWFGKLVGGVFTTINRRSASGTRAAPEANSQRFSGELAYHLFDRPALRAMIAPAAMASGTRANRRGPAADAEDDTLLDATALLRSVASGQLAEALKIVPPSP